MVYQTCDPAGARTQDPLLKREMLYQLSYGISLFKSTAKVTGDVRNKKHMCSWHSLLPLLGTTHWVNSV